MNITELIVELLQNGQKVELSGIGTFDSMMQSPHHDAESHIYYPASRNIVFQKETSGDESIVKIIAKRECVNDDVAGQMWRNYCDALADKVRRAGSHQLGEMGVLSKSSNGYEFASNKNFVLDTGNSSETPLEEVKVYAHNDNDDPFAQFDGDTLVKVVERAKEEEPKAPTVEATPTSTADSVADDELVAVPVQKPESSHTPASTAKPETESEEAEIDDEWRETLRKLDEMPKSEEALRAEEKARMERAKALVKKKEKEDKEQAKMDRLAEKHHEIVERMIDEEREASARRDADNRRRAEEEIRNAELRAEENRVNSEKQSEAALALAEQKAEEERIKAEKRAAILAAVAAKEAASRPQPASTPAATPTSEAPAAPEPVEYEAPRIMSEKERKRVNKEVERRMKEDQKRQAAEKEAAEKEATRKLKEDKKREKEALKEARKQAKQNAKYAKQAEKTMRKEKEGKKRHGWIIILIILLLLLLGGGAYYYFFMMNGNSLQRSGKVAPKGKHLDVPAENDLTYNVDMIPYTKNEIEQNRDLVCRFMADYISRFIASEGYANARVPMMDRVRQYAGERMNTLLGDRFAVQRLIPYNDYIYNYCEPWLKGYYADSARTLVQGELLNPDALEDMLNQMIDELGLQPDSHTPVTAATTDANRDNSGDQTDGHATAKKKKLGKNDNPVYVYVEKDSKQGFDIIAGFYLNKSTAAKMTARLHELGCDAYIIEKNEMFYVSMGSAPTRTKAEALYNHIKGWYDGDIVIKQL